MPGSPLGVPSFVKLDSDSLPRRLDRTLLQPLLLPLVVVSGAF
jgi:hypothetical protein